MENWNVPLNGQTQVAAHRGANQWAPENTLAAAQKAMEAKTDFIEIDVHTTADHHMIIIHDRTLDRTTNGQGAVKEWIWDSILLLSAGAWFSPEFSSEKVPLLESFCALVRNYTAKENQIVNLYVDCKSIIPKDLVDILSQYQLLDGAVFYGSENTLLALKGINPKVKIMPALSSVDDYNALVRRMQPYALDVRWEDLSLSLVAKAHKQGVRVFSDGIGPHREGVASYVQAMEMGIDVIQTDNLDEFHQANALFLNRLK